MPWRLLLEEYAPELIYLTGEHNIVADALSRLELETPDLTLDNMHDVQYLADHFTLDDDDLPADAFPLHYKLIVYKLRSINTKTLSYSIHSRQHVMAIISNPFVEAARNKIYYAVMIK